MRLKTASPEHEVAYQDLCALASKHAGKLSSMELLAIAANMLGKLMAMQDQRTVTSAIAMEVVIQNLQQGNQQAIEQLMNSKGSA